MKQPSSLTPIRPKKVVKLSQLLPLADLNSATTLDGMNPLSLNFYHPKLPKQCDTVRQASARTPNTCVQWKHWYSSSCLIAFASLDLSFTLQIKAEPEGTQLRAASVCKAVSLLQFQSDC